MLKHVLRVLALVLVVAVGIAVYLGWPDSARLSVEQVAGRRPAITDPREQMIPTVGIAKPIGWQGAAIADPGRRVEG